MSIATPRGHRAALALIAAIALAGQVLGCGSRRGSRAPSDPVTCEEVRGHVEALYRGRPGASDDVALLMADCAAEPARVAPCARQAGTVYELETRCLLPLDHEAAPAAVPSS
jgi:hypothetical protein